MDSDTFIPQFWKATRILGLEKLTAKIIEATGIKLSEFTSAADQEKSVTWNDAGGIIREYMSGWKTAGIGGSFFHNLSLSARGWTGEGAGVSTFLDLVSDDGGEEYGAINLGFLPEPEPGLYGVRLLDTNGSSDFLRHFAGGWHGKVAGGLSTWSMAGGSTLGGISVVEHNIGFTPAIVLTNGMWANGLNYAIVFELRPVIVNEFFIDFQAIASSPLPGGGLAGLPFSWLAIA